MYSRRLDILERRLFAMDLVLAIAAPSSAVAGLWLWDTELGGLAWKVLGVVAAVTAVVKPLFSLPRRIKDMEGVLSGYRTLEYDLSEIRTLVEQSQDYGPPLREEFKKAIQREKALVGKTPETREDRKTKAICEQEVNNELPPESFFVPQ